MKKWFLLGLVMILLSGLAHAEFDNGTLFYNWESGAGNLDDQWGVNDGVVTGMIFTSSVPTFAISGTSGDWAGEFDGTNDQVITTNNVIFNTGESFSFSMWKNASDTRVDGMAFGTTKNNGGYTAGLIIYEEKWSPADACNGLAVFRFEDDTSTVDVRFCQTDVNIYDGLYHSEVIIYNHTTDDCDWYVDGVSRAITFTAGSCNLAANNINAGGNNGKITLGRRDSSDTLYSKMNLDNFRVFTDRAITQTEVENLHNYGQLTTPASPTTIFKFNITNFQDGSPILDFTAEISNGTFTQNKTSNSSDGSVKWNISEIINITVFNITGTEGVYLNRTFLNIQTNTSITGQVWQSLISIKGQDSRTGDPVTSFNVTLNDTLNISDGGISIFRTNAGLLNYSATAENYETITLGDISLFNANITNLTINFTNDVQNVLTFLNSTNPVVGAEVNVTYPSGTKKTLITNASGQVNFSTVLLGSYDYGTYNISFAVVGLVSFAVLEIINVTNSPITITYNIALANININIFDRETFNLLVGIPVNISILNFLNANTDTGKLVISNQTILEGTLIIQAFANGYLTEQQTVVYTSQDNATVNFYMLNSTGSNTALLFTSSIDEFFRTLEGAKISLFQYNPLVASFIKVSEILSNVNGEAVFSIELNFKTYFLTASKTIDGVLYTTETNPEIIKTADEVRNLVLRLSQSVNIVVTDYLIIDYSETFVNNVSTIFVEYTTRDNFVAEVCVGYFNMSDNAVLVSEQCVNSSASYTAIPTLIERQHDYQGRIYQRHNGEDILIAVYHYKSIRSFDEIFSATNYSKPLFAWLWVVLLVVSLLLKNMVLFSIGGIILTWVQFFNLPSVALASASVLKTAILIFMYNSSRRREDLN